MRWPMTRRELAKESGRKFKNLKIFYKNVTFLMYIFLKYVLLKNESFLRFNLDKKMKFTRILYPLTYSLYNIGLMHVVMKFFVVIL